MNLLRSGLVHNLGNITAPWLYSCAFACTKLLIEDYITQVALVIKHMTIILTTPPHHSGISLQVKLELLHDTWQAFSRSMLVLQGGAIFRLCHLGIAKALHLRSLLPQIITGMVTGVLIAAIVAVHTKEELLDFLTGDCINLSAFKKCQDKTSTDSPTGLGLWLPSGWLGTVKRWVTRFVNKGYFLDVDVLGECVQANIGDLMFEEVYARTKRVLNVAVLTNS